MKFDSGLVLDKGLDQAAAIVKDAFASRGFVVTTTEIGREPNVARPGEPRRYLHLRATLPELTFPGAGGNGTSVLGCKLSLIERNGAETLVTADAPLDPYPLLARLIPRVTHRVDDALAGLRRYTSTPKAA